MSDSNPCYIYHAQVLKNYEILLAYNSNSIGKLCETKRRPKSKRKQILKEAKSRA